MPPPHRRRPVQPATRVRIPRTARSRGPQAGEPAGGGLPVAEAPENGLAPDDLTHDDLTPDDLTGQEPTGDDLLEDHPPGDEPTGPEPAADDLLQDHPAADEPTQTEPAADDQVQEEPAADSAVDGEPTADEPAGTEPAPAAEQKAARDASRHPLLLPACLGALAVILGGLATWFGLEASSATSGVDVSNTALTDPAATREVTQQVTGAVNKIFSYNYADTAKTSQAAATLLTGKARQQYDTLFKLVRQDAPQEKLILTTTVTNSGVEFLDGNRARLLIFADQRDTAGAAHKTTDAGAMFAVNAVSQGGRWKISSIDTFGAAG
jgi:Mce-associated membrane protein